MGEEGGRGFLAFWGFLVFGWDGIAEKRRLTDFLVGVGKPQLSFEW
jgi:hypothetical protein